MKKKSESFEKLYKECSGYTLNDFELDSAVVVRPTKKLKKTYPLSLRIHKADIIEAKLIGQIKGIPYQTLLKSYIKDGLKNDKKLITYSKA